MIMIMLKKTFYPTFTYKKHTHMNKKKIRRRNLIYNFHKKIYQPDHYHYYYYYYDCYDYLHNKSLN